MRTPLLTLLFLLSLIRIPAQAAPDAANLVVNGDFSRTTGERPVAWETEGDSAAVSQSLAVIPENGSPCARLTCTRLVGQGGSVHAMIAQVGHVRLVQGRYYELSCRAREESLAGRSVNVAIQDTALWEECGLHQSLSLSAQWRPFRFVFRATRSVDTTSRLQFWFTETGSLFLADVRIAETDLQRSEFTDVVASAGGKNLVPNGSFTAGASGWSSLGIPAGWGNIAHLHGAVQADGSPPHRTYLRIPFGGGRTPSLYFDYLRPAAQLQTRLLAASRGWIPMEPGSAYTLSCEMRATEEGVPAVLGIVGANPEDDGGNQEHAEQKTALSTAWRRYTFTFRPSRRYAFVVLGPDLDRDRRVDVDVTNIQLEKGDRATAYTPRADVEIGLEPSEPGGIFVEGDGAALILRAHNHSGAPAAVRIGFHVTDYNDRPVPLPAISIDIPPASTTQQRILLPRDWRGYYRVRIVLRAPGRSETRLLRLAVVPRRTSGDTVLGINHAFPDGFLIRQARNAGVTWYRDWSLKWQDMEPAAGQFRWEIADTQIDRVLGERARLMALLPPFPSAAWNSEAPADLAADAEGRRREAWAPKDPSLLAQFVGRAVSRYKDRIHDWEFLNEPLYTDYALPGQSGSTGRRYTPEDYVGYLKQAAAAMRRSDPSCRVIGGVASGPEFLTHALMEAGILDAIDIFNLHIYPEMRAPEGYIPAMDRFVADMERHGARKPIWITEFSYYADDDVPRRPYVPGEGSWAEQRLLSSERECADYTIRFFAIMLAHGAEKIFIHSGASGSVNEPNEECCLFDYGGAPRKAVPALAVFTELVGSHPKCVLDRPLGNGGRVAAFETGARSVVMLWSESDSGPRVAAPAHGVQCLDIVGRSVAPAVIHLSASPVYLVGAPGRAVEIARTLTVSHR